MEKKANRGKILGMGISNFTLNRIYNSFSEHLKDAKVERIINISDNDYLLSVFKDGKSSNVLLSLDPSLPLMIESESFKIDSVNPSNAQCNMLRKYLDHASISSLEKVENDRIIILKARKWTQSYQMLESTMIFELFPLSPNIIFVDGDYKIMDAFKHSDSLESKHLIYRNLKYEFPLATDKYFDENSSFEDLKGKLLKSEIKYLESLDHDAFRASITTMMKETRYFVYKNEVSSLKITPEAREMDLGELFMYLLDKKEKENRENRFEHIFRLVEQKIKSARKRITNIEHDKDKFLSYSQYQEKGTLLYMGSDSYKRGDKKVTIEGTEIELDPKLDLNDNAQHYFKLYKKARAGLIQVEIQKDNALKELDYFLRIESQIKFASPKDMEEIILDLIEHHYIKDSKVSSRAKKQPSQKKYNPHFIKLPNGIKIGYGLSSFQNEELTFNQAKKDDIYLHIKDYHGPHVIIFDAHPDEDTLRIGGEIALYYAGYTTGEVYYTRRSNVKKVPGERGLVTMTSMKTMVIGEILPSTMDLIRRN